MRLPKSPNIGRQHTVSGFPPVYARSGAPLSSPFAQTLRMAPVPAEVQYPDRTWPVRTSAWQFDGSRRKTIAATRPVLFNLVTMSASPPSRSAQPMPWSTQSRPSQTLTPYPSIRRILQSTTTRPASGRLPSLLHRCPQLAPNDPVKITSDLATSPHPTTGLSLQSGASRTKTGAARHACSRGPKVPKPPRCMHALRPSNSSLIACMASTRAVSSADHSVRCSWWSEIPISRHPSAMEEPAGR